MNTMQMNTMQNPTQPDYLSASLLTNPSVDTPAARPAKSKNDQLPVKSSWRPLAFARHVIVLLIGVALTLAWQTYGDSARDMVASIVFSPDKQQYNARSLDLDAIRQGVGEIATSIASIQEIMRSIATNQEQAMRSIAINQERIMRTVDQVTAGQEQMTHEIAKLQAVDQVVLHSSPDPSPRQTPAPVTKPALRQSQKPTALTPAKNP